MPDIVLEPSAGLEITATTAVPSIVIHTEIKTLDGHKVEFHVIDRLNTNILELVVYDYDTTLEYDRLFFFKSVILDQVKSSAQAQFETRVADMKGVQENLPPEDVAVQNEMLLDVICNQLAGEYIISQIKIDIKSSSSPGGLQIVTLDEKSGESSQQLVILAPTPEGQSDVTISRKPKEERKTSIKQSTKSSKERKRRHTIKDVMAEHAMEVLGGILGLPSRDAADDGAKKSTKSTSSRQRRHTTETDPRRRPSVSAGERRSSKDTGRPPSGSQKYDLDAIAQQNIRKKNRPTSVKEKMAAHTIEVVANVVEGVKSILVSPKVGVDSTSAAAEGNSANASAAFFPDDSGPANTSSKILVSETAVPVEKTVIGSAKAHNASVDSLISPKEDIAEASPVAST